MPETRGRPQQFPVLRIIATCRRVLFWVQNIRFCDNAFTGFLLFTYRRQANMLKSVGIFLKLHTLVSKILIAVLKINVKWCCY